MKTFLLLFATAVSVMGAILPPSTKSHIYTTGTLAQVNGHVGAVLAGGSNIVGGTITAQGTLTAVGDLNVDGTATMANASVTAGPLNLFGGFFIDTGNISDGDGSVLAITPAGNGVLAPITTDGGNVEIAGTVTADGFLGNGPSLLELRDAAGNLYLWSTNGLLTLTNNINQGLSWDTNGTSYINSTNGAGQSVVWRRRLTNSTLEQAVSVNGAAFAVVSTLSSSSFSVPPLASSGNVSAGGASSIFWTSRARFSSPADGHVSVQNAFQNALAAKFDVGNLYASTNVVATNAVFVGGAAGPSWRSGAGSPESAVTAPVGSLYSRTDGGAVTTLYVKESGAGNTGWVAK